MKQEGGHIDFYASEATRRLGESPKAQTMTRFALSHWWPAVGSGVMPKRESRVSRQLPLSTEHKGSDVLERIDRRVDRLAGAEGPHLLTRAVSRLSSLLRDFSLSDSPQRVASETVVNPLLRGAPHERQIPERSPSCSKNTQDPTGGRV